MGIGAQRQDVLRSFWLGRMTRERMGLVQIPQRAQPLECLGVDGRNLVFLQLNAGAKNVDFLPQIIEPYRVRQQGRFSGLDEQAGMPDKRDLEHLEKLSPYNERNQVTRAEELIQVPGKPRK